MSRNEQREMSTGFICFSSFYAYFEQGNDYCRHGFDVAAPADWVREIELSVAAQERSFGRRKVRVSRLKGQRSAMELARIRQAITREELIEVARFRYRIYVGEMGRFQQYADHTRKTVCEPLDRQAHVLMALEGPKLVGTVRVNLGSECDLGAYADLYRLRELGSIFPKKVSITTKLMVAPEYRGTPLVLKLAVACYKYASGLGIEIDAIDCNPPLTGFFFKLGYRQVFDAIHHPEYGRVIPMFLAVRDKHHLHRVASPFSRHARALVNDRGAGDILNSLASPCRPASTNFIGATSVLKGPSIADCPKAVCPESENG